MTGMLAVLAWAITIQLPSLYKVSYCIVPVIVRVLFDTRLALNIHLLMVLLAAFFVPNSFEFVFLQFSTGMVAIYSIKTLIKREQFLISVRSEEHTSELQSLMRISYAVFCLKKKKKIKNITIQQKYKSKIKRNTTQQQKSDKAVVIRTKEMTTIRAPKNTKIAVIHSTTHKLTTTINTTSHPRINKMTT